MPWDMQDERTFIDSVGIYRNEQTLSSVGRIVILRAYLEGLKLRRVFPADMTPEDCRAHAERRIAELTAATVPEDEERARLADEANRKAHS